jgi:hypothetical protein
VTNTHHPLDQHHRALAAADVSKKERAADTLLIWVFVVTTRRPDVSSDVAGIIKPNFASLAFATISEARGFVGAAGACCLAAGGI